jgi:hypothetical protein
MFCRDRCYPADIVGDLSIHAAVVAVYVAVWTAHAVVEYPVWTRLAHDEKNRYRNLGGQPTPGETHKGLVH